MSSQVRYQIFVSSTYEDLRLERQQATQAVLEAGGFPAGMELFPASDETQWELIKNVIRESDYYIVIVAGKYGSLGPAGKSFTEMEYDFAIENGVPVLGFVRADIENLPAKHSEPDSNLRSKLEAFRKKVMSKTCRKFTDPSELGMAILKSIMHQTKVRPRMGWVRADQARSEADLKREIELRDAVQEVLNENERLKRELWDRAILPDDIDREDLSQGSDLFEFSTSFRDATKELVVQKVALSWDEIFRTIGPSMYGYVLRKVSQWGRRAEYGFESDLKEVLRAKLIDRCGNRQIELLSSKMDECIFQFKELGYVEFSEVEEKGGDDFRGITLTEAGERYLTRLKISVRRR